MRLRVESDGTILGLYDEKLDLSAMGNLVIQRASQVEPQGDTWTVDLALSDGPILPGFAKRSEAIQAEVQWLENHRL